MALSRARRTVFSNTKPSKPAIIGTTTFEGNAVVNWTSLAPPPAADQLESSAVTLAGFSAPAAAETTDRQTAGVVTYRYRYNGNFTDLSPLPWQGAYHASDLPLVFGTYGQLAPATAYETALSHYMQELWLAFMVDPVNGPSTVGWPVAVGTSVLEFD